ncbi:MAG: NAAT family transporter [Chlamydiia bacterium]|nr:NAAT family transporter [Chlamydiia bacterium]
MHIYLEIKFQSFLRKENEVESSPMRPFFSTTLTLFFIIDALGILPTYLGLVKAYPPKKQRFIAIRELIFALIVMVLFHYIGHALLSVLSISQSTLQISGGIIFFLIAIRLIFPKESESTSRWQAQVTNPFIVPIATPLIAGPSLMAAIMIYSREIPGQHRPILLSIFVAWAISTVIILFANPIFKVMREKGLSAFQRLMGLILALIAVQMFLLGIKALITSLI